LTVLLKATWNWCAKSPAWEQPATETDASSMLSFASVMGAGFQGGNLSSSVQGTIDQAADAELVLAGDMGRERGEDESEASHRRCIYLPTAVKVRR